MTINIPEGMIHVVEFGKIKGIKPEKVIDMIRDGFYVGRKVGDDWFIDESELQGKKSKQKSKNSAIGISKSNSDYQEVVVTDIQMPFGSMVTFMVKWVIASIPAFIILFMLFAIVSAIFGGILAGVGNSRY